MNFLQNIINYSRFANLPRDWRRIVFYSESRADWPHLEPLILELVHKQRQRVTYVCSDDKDPGLQSDLPLFRAFQVGTGIARTIFFQLLEADIVLMTMPDLDRFHLKRSKRTASYVYVFHAINSAHMIYPARSFDAYDIVFCAGEHHCTELQILARLHGLIPRRLVKYGYGRLDHLLAFGRARDSSPDVADITVLVAPTWGPTSLLESCGSDLIDALLAAGMKVILRPHPATLKSHPTSYRQLLSRFSAVDRFSVDASVDGRAAMEAANALVTDWSGIGFEFAFAYCRPILFVDVPPKIRNPMYRDVDSPPIEIALRNQLGTILQPSEVVLAPARIRACIASREAQQDVLISLREKCVFNVGTSAAAGAKALMDILRETGGRPERKP